MNREPNPYLKNPRLTVTSTMSISVPSMVAEDVLDGPDIITVDPELSGRVDAVSEVVDLMDTRIDSVSASVDLLDTHIDAVSEKSVLFYNNCVKFDSTYLREVIAYKTSDCLTLMARDTGSNQSSLSYYPLYAPSFYCGTNGEFEFRVTDASNGSGVPSLQMRSLQGTWVTITGDNNSSSGSGESDGSWTGIATALATYLNEDGYVSDNASGEFKVLLGSNRRDAASGVITLYLEDAYGAVTSGVGVLLNASLIAGRGEGDSRYVYGGIRPVISEDNGLYWECRSLEDPNWAPIAAPETLYTTCLYSTGLANADSDTSIDSVGASISYGVDWSNSSDLGYLTIKRESREGSDTRQISLHDLYWLLGNKAKLEELLK